MIIEYSNRNSQTGIISHALINATRNTHHITDHIHNQQRMTENLRAIDFSVHCCNQMRAIFNSKRARVTCELITTQGLTTPDIAISDNFGCDWNFLMI